jgi:hypothetical protein
MATHPFHGDRSTDVRRSRMDACFWSIYFLFSASFPTLRVNRFVDKSIGAVDSLGGASISSDLSISRTNLSISYRFRKRFFSSATHRTQPILLLTVLHINQALFHRSYCISYAWAWVLHLSEEYEMLQGLLNFVTCASVTQGKKNKCRCLTFLKKGWRV